MKSLTVFNSPIALATEKLNITENIVKIDLINDVQGTYVICVKAVKKMSVTINLTIAFLGNTT